jgi:FtsH-binding integral membrane protein
MSRRANVTGEKETDKFMDIETGSSSKMKPDTIYELMKLRELQSFVSKIYWLVILCFVGIGVIMALVLSDGTFSDVFMAENLLSSVGISMYILLMALICMCNSHNEMRVVLLLTILFFTGCLSGFMLALHLLDVSITLQSAKNHT